MVSVFESPEGFRFDSLRGFFADPEFETSGGPSSQFPVFHRIFVDEALTQEVWNSFTDALPQDTTVDLSIHAGSFALDKVYVLSTARFDASRGVSPILVNLGVQFTTAVST